MSVNTVPIEQPTLDRLGRDANLVVRSVLDAQGFTFEENLPAIHTALQTANAASQRVYQTLLSIGASVPGGPAPEPVDLALLDTPATRRLLDALQFAVACAQEVDRERGWTLASGEGCGWTDAVGDMAERLRQEVEGPKGRD